MSKHVVVIGGGITGLVAAYRLTRLARSRGCDLHVTVLEAQNRLGGRIFTEKVEGLTLEGGADSFVTLKPQALELVGELGLLDHVLTTSRTNTDVYVFVRGRLRRLPAGLFLMAPVRLLPFLRSDLMPWLGKLRMGLDLILPPGEEEDVSMADFTRRRFGSEALRTIVQPVLAGIYAGDADELSLKNTFPQFLELERRYGSVIRGLRAQKRQARRERFTMFVTLTGGLGGIIDALAQRLEPNGVRLGARVTRIFPQGRAAGYRIMLESDEHIDGDAVILTTPSWQASEMLKPMDPQLAAALLGIPFASTATMTLCFHESPLTNFPKGFGFVAARGETRIITAGTFIGDKFPGRVPSGRVLVRCFLGGVGREAGLHGSDAALVAAVRADLQRIFDVRAEPSWVRLYRWNQANPQYVVGHERRLKRISQCVARHPGLLLAGSSYRGVGIPDCVAAGAEAANSLYNLLADSGMSCRAAGK